MLGGYSLHIYIYVKDVYDTQKETHVAWRRSGFPYLVVWTTSESRTLAVTSSIANSREATNLEAALNYSVLGWRVHPLHNIRPDGTCSCGKPNNAPGHKAGKHPRISSWQDNATTDPGKVIKWWNKWADANIGIVCDELVVIDVDPRNGGSLQPSFDAYPDLKDVFDTAYTVRTGDKSGEGRHYYFKGTGNFPKKKHGLGKGIEVIHGHNYVIAPPSCHLHGTRYELLSDTLTDLPPILNSVIQDGQQGSVFGGVIPEGSRNDTLASIAGSFFRDGLNLIRVKQCLHEENYLRCKPPLDYDEVEAIAESIRKLSHSDKVSIKTHWQEGLIRSGMNDKAVRILMALSLYADADGTSCFPSQQTLADDVGCSRQTVSKYLQQADEDGYLSRYRIGREGPGWRFGYLLRPSSSSSSYG